MVVLDVIDLYFFIRNKQNNLITCDKYKHIVKRGTHNDIESCFKDTMDIFQMVVFDINDV